MPAPWRGPQWSRPPECGQDHKQHLFPLLDYIARPRRRSLTDAIKVPKPLTPSSSETDYSGLIRWTLKKGLGPSRRRSLQAWKRFCCWPCRTGRVRGPSQQGPTRASRHWAQSPDNGEQNYWDLNPTTQRSWIMPPTTWAWKKPQEIRAQPRSSF